MKPDYVVLTAVGRDKPGMVEMITDTAVANHANIEESRMARLGGEFAVLMLLSVAAEREDALVADLQALTRKGLTVVARPTDISRVDALKGHVPYHLSVAGADHEGIVNRVARYLASEAINVDAMDTHVTRAPNTGTPLFSLRAVIQVPPHLSLGPLRRKLAEVSAELDVDIELKLPAPE
jgi:glycine cleavage system transcriptional repressor